MLQIVYSGDLCKNVEEKEPPIKPINATSTNLISDLLPIKPKSYSCIRQPLVNVNINDTLYYFAADESQEFFYESGSKVMIDANSFLTGENEPYTGVVRLFYREFRNPVEIMLSGIPMKNAENGEEKLFKSGGMYEIKAFDRTGEELKTRSDTSVKINFALSDTSSSFEFFSLENDGSWTTSPVKVNSVPANNSIRKPSQLTKAVMEYTNYLYYRNYLAADTTNFYERFDDTSYLYVYRRDNFKIHKDSIHYSFEYPYTNKLKGFFKVKYLKQTRDKKILFTLVENVNANFRHTPRYMRTVLNRVFIYNGALTKEQFRKKFHHRLYGWDIQCSEAGNTLLLLIKTTHGYENISCQLATLFSDGYYKAVENSGNQLASRFNRLLNVEANFFNKKRVENDRGRFYHGDFNRVNETNRTAEQAYQYSKKFQTQAELQLDFESWKKYVKSVAPDLYAGLYNSTNEVGSALVKSGMGIKNIDAYIHSGEMENIVVNYKNIDLDTLSDQFHVMLYKNINTSYSLTKNYEKLSSLRGYYFKNQPNYIIRFSEEGFMQVTKPNVISGLRVQNEISLDFKREYLVKGLNSSQITRLILE